MVNECFEQLNAKALWAIVNYQLLIVNACLEQLKALADKITSSK
jgi:hypothetical protein